MDLMEELSVKVSQRSKGNIIRELYVAPKPLRGYEIAERVGLDKSTVNHHLSQLEKMAIVEKKKIDSIKVYSLTDIGKKLYETLSSGYLTEHEEIDLHAQELASILGIDTNSDLYNRLRNKIGEWYFMTKEGRKEKLKKITAEKSYIG